MNHMTAYPNDASEYTQTEEEYLAQMEEKYKYKLDELDSLTDDEITDAYISNYDLDPIDIDQMWLKLRNDILNEKNVVL